MKRWFTKSWACLVVMVPVLVGSAEAQNDFAPPPRDRPGFIIPPRRPLNVSLEILVDGRPLPTIQHQGQTYLPVPRLGAEYQVRVTNHGPTRIGALVSVDGLSVITGKPASEDQPGYLVPGNDSVVIRGWRRNMDTVAAFSFADRPDTYAVQRGHTDQIGVISLLAIEEAVPHPRPFLRPKFAEQADRAAALAPAPGRVGNTGTAYGRDVDSRVQEVPFVRSANRRTITIHYDTVGALRRAGVPVDGAGGNIDFAPPPGKR